VEFDDAAVVLSKPRSPLATGSLSGGRFIFIHQYLIAERPPAPGRDVLFAAVRS
jgi:hypothetical protein